MSSTLNPNIGLEIQSPEPTNLADMRQEEIILDHAIAKSSNVTTPDAGTPNSKTASFTSSPVTGTQTKTVSQPVLPSATSDFVEAPKRHASFDIEDDFFSMAPRASPIPTKPKEKKKKKKRKVKTTSDLSREGSVVASSNPEDAEAKPVVLATTQNDIPNDAEVISLSDEDKPRPTRRLTPPPVDEIEFMKSFKEGAQRKIQDAAPVIDLDDDDDVEDVYYSSTLKSLKSFTEKLAAKRTNRGKSDLSDGKEEDDTAAAPLRTYDVNIRSFLPGSEDSIVDVQVIGDKKFGKVMKKVLKHFISMNDVAEQYIPLYSPEFANFIWRSGKSLIKVTEFMSPNGLQLPPTVKNLEFELHTNEQINDLIEEHSRIQRARKLAIEREKLLDAQAEAAARAVIVDVEEEDDDDDDEDFREVDLEIEKQDAVRSNASGPTQKSPEPEEDKDAEDYFKIGLKGEDNKKVFVQVNPETQISKIVEYYLTQKNLPQTTKVRLVFDDEDIELDQTVGDTELEEDFTVEVYILS